MLGIQLYIVDFYIIFIIKLVNTCDAEGNAFVRGLKWLCDEALKLPSGST